MISEGDGQLHARLEALFPAAKSEWGGCPHGIHVADLGGAVSVRVQVVCMCCMCMCCVCVVCMCKLCER